MQGLRKPRGEGVRFLSEVQPRLADVILITSAKVRQNFSELKFSLEKQHILVLRFPKSYLHRHEPVMTHQRVIEALHATVLQLKITPCILAENSYYIYIIKFLFHFYTTKI